MNWSPGRHGISAWCRPGATFVEREIVPLGSMKRWDDDQYSTPTADLYLPVGAGRPLAPRWRMGVRQVLRS
jgi:hypothetical protein